MLILVGRALFFFLDTSKFQIYPLAGALCFDLFGFFNELSIGLCNKDTR